MAIYSIVFGILLVALAAFGYLGSPAESRSPTALIPLGAGIPLLLCGLVALNERYRKHAMHVAAGFALLGTVAAGGRGIPGLIKLLSVSSRSTAGISARQGRHCGPQKSTMTGNSDCKVSLS